MVMTQPVEVHTSDRLAYKRCRRKWDLGSYMRGNLQPDRINDKLWLGTGVHDALSEYYIRGTELVHAFDDWCTAQVKAMQDRKEIWEEQRTMLNDTIAFGLGILDHYATWCKTEDPKWWVKVIETETSFRLPILDLEGKETGAYYAGRIDGIVEDEYGMYWLLEHKTAAGFESGKLPLDEQCGAYIWAAQQIYGVKLEGVIYNVIKKKLPRYPELLKKGGLSVNKAIDTTYDVYMLALEDHYGSAELIPMAQYAEILQTLQDKGNTFFLREKVYRSQAEIEDIGRRIFHEYSEMIRPDLHCYPNPTRDCGWDCDFRSVCLAMNDGSDYQYILRSLFRKRAAEDAATELVDD